MTLYLLLCFYVNSCGNSQSNISQENCIEESSISEELKDITSQANNVVDSILTSLSLEERVGQCIMPSLNATSNRENVNILLSYINDYHVGGVVIMKGSLENVRKMTEIGYRSKIPLFFAIDAEWGLGMRLEDAPTYPKNGFINKDAGEAFLFDYGQEIAKESREVGINMVLGPVIDLASQERHGVIGNRSFGDNPSLVSDYGVAYAKGLEARGVISVAKHFPGHGGAINDSHEKAAILNRNITMLDSMDLRPFKEYINAGLSGIMAGHIRAKALDPDGTVASVSMDILTSLLREEMGFSGLVVTDAFNMGGAKDYTAVDAVKAGADLILCPEDVKKEYDLLLTSVISGKLDIKVINDRCRRILFYKVIFGLI